MTSIVFDEPARSERASAVQQRGPRPGWVRGFVATALVIAGLEFLARAVHPVPNIGVLLILVVVYTAIVGGLAAALVCAGACLAYASYDLADAGFLRYGDESRARLVMLWLALPLAAVMVGILRRRAGAALAQTLARERAAAAEAAALVEHRISELHGQMDAQHARVQHLLANVPGVVFETYTHPDPAAGRVNYASEYLERMLGYPVARWLEQPDFLLTAVYPDDRERVRQDMENALSRGEGQSQFRCVARDGRVLWVEANCTAVRDAAGNPVGLRGVITDISRLKRAHYALRKRAAVLVRVARQLKRSNEELDQFAYITSHDLRAPLRGIANLSRWIEEDMGERFTPEAHAQMELLRGRVHRMEALIDGILQYSRVGRAEVAPERVDVGRLVREVVDLLAPPQGFVVDVAPDLPTIVAQRLRLQQVFLNLIGNAVKHHPRPHEGRVRVGWRDLGALCEFTVADDGAGIAPKYHDKIFVIFQTLEARDKVEGTGVGLSLVKKIVEHQGGTIRVESRPGAGATFAFTWPRHAQPARHARPNGATPR